MQEESSQKPWRLILGIVLVASVLGGGIAWFLGQSNSTKTPVAQSTASPAPIPTALVEQTPQPSPLNSVQPSPIASVQPSTPPSVASDGKAQSYWLKPSRNQTEFIPNAGQAVATKPSDAEALDQAFRQLLAGPTAPNVSTTIPKGTTLRNLALKADGVHVDLSKEFTAGGGSESMKGRLGQILYTATSLKADTPVWISVEGKPLEVLGGEGLAVDQPLTRKVFEKEY